MTRTLFFDIETNAINDWSTYSDLHTVHCLSIYDPMIPKMLTFHGESIERGLLELQKAERIVGHNVIDFDIPALKKLYGFSPPLIKVLDTLVVSRCVFPDLRNDDFGRNGFDKALVGSHSLKAWGHRMGSTTKLTYGEEDDAFNEYNDEMRKYCERDVIVTQLLYDFLFKHMPSKEMIAIEHWFKFIISMQERHGFKFDLDKADVLTAKLMGIRAKLTTDLQNAWKPTKVEMKSPAGWTLTTDQATYEGKTKNDLKLQLKEAGEVQALVKNAVKTGNAVKEIPFNPGSRKQIAERLMGLGYELPTENDGVSYKVDESVLRGIDHPIAEDLLSYLLVQKRLGQLAEGQQAWLKLQKNGVIHGSVNTNGAVTGRCTHSNPNVAQVPSVRADYGTECRELFTVRNGYKLVGCDASGLELRMLAHYMAFYDGGQYAKIVTEGDVHTVNQQAAGLETRDQAKTFIYALLYGAGDEKIGNIAGGNAQLGQKLKRKFFSSLPALARLQADVQRKVKHGGELKGLDGRILPIRSSHAALNMLLQSAGAVVMKVALVQLFHKINQLRWQHGREYAFVANIHDEFQAEVLPDKAEAFGHLAVESIAHAGQQLRMNVRLDGEFKIGNNWAETH
jgi:DNA polymerase I-like protein with 3'-5' exonuclease and polymerase domains